MNRRLIPFLFVLVIPSRASIPQPVTISTGQLTGAPSSTNPALTVFKGIPYAAPPRGELRWRAPQPPAPWTGIRKADHFSASCIQNLPNELRPWGYEFLTHNEISEDCLYLNVWTPAQAATAKLPVFFWIYGGANTSGSAAVPLYDGEGLAKKGLVVVTINYRVGVFGFFVHPELTKEAGSSGNYGILDQVAALKWVRDNIAAFGGDPSRVTIAGQSAGGSNVHILVASPLAKGLFAGAIEESGSDLVDDIHPLAEREQDGERFAGAKSVSSLAGLRALSAHELMQPVPSAPRFGPVVDGNLLTAMPIQIYAQGKQNDVPELTGWTKDEGGALPHPEITAAAFERLASLRFGKMSAKFLKLYPPGSPGQSRNESARDEMRTAMYLWALNRARTAKTNVFTYYWDHALPGPEAAHFGAFHSSEIPYVFNSLAQSNRPFTETDRRIAETMSSYWANFVATGDPNGPGLAHWPSVQEKPGFTMELGEKNAPIPVAGDEAKERFFRELFAWLLPKP